MNKKILIGSIIAVAVLIGVSFTSVIGYNNIKSDSISTSPLFKVRTDRAIGEDDKVLTCDYVGKGNILSFPERDEITIMIEKIVNNLRKMDDKTFEKFIASIINNIQKDNRFNRGNHDWISEALNILRNSNKPIQNIDAKIKNNHNNQFQTSPVTVCCKTQGLCPFTLNAGKEGIYNCIYLLITAPFLIILEILGILYNFLVKFPTIPLGICISINC